MQLVIYRLPVCLLLSVCLITSTKAQDQAASEKPLERILFGSCIQQDQPMPILRTMKQAAPQLLIFLGDNIYADTHDMEVMRRKYNTLGQNKEFRALVRSCPVLATWDDHDYGVNDGGADYTKRVEAQKEYLRFWSQYSQTPPADQVGIYDAHYFGPEGKRIQVLMLDTRYFRSPLKAGPRRTGGPYYPDDDPTKTMLGETQWKWLEKQLKEPAQLRIIGTSIQFIAEAAGQETWSNLPHERARLLQLINKTGASGVLLISGDRHWAECSVIRDDVPYPLYDLTSSSLNQKHSRGTPTINRFRTQDRSYHEENFGVVSVDWEQEDAQVTLEIRDLENRSRIHRTISLSQLRGE